MLKKSKKTLGLICCLMLTFTSVSFADSKEQNEDISITQQEESIINFEVSGYKYIYKDAPQEIKNEYAKKCAELGITPAQDAEIVIPEEANLLSSDNLDAGTYSTYYGEYNSSKGTIKISGGANYTISTSTLVGYGYTTSGNAVHCLQIMLSGTGYKVSIDSIFGSDTYNKLKSFQTNNALVSDGICGKSTWDKMARKLNW